MLNRKIESRFDGLNRAVNEIAAIEIKKSVELKKPITPEKMPIIYDSILRKFFSTKDGIAEDWIEALNSAEGIASMLGRLEEFKRAVDLLAEEKRCRDELKTKAEVRQAAWNAYGPYTDYPTPEGLEELFAQKNRG